MAQEMAAQPGYSDNPVGDEQAIRGGGVLHKYQGRVLLITTGACAVNCRYCFRRHFPYQQNFAARQNWAEAIAYIQSQPDVHEVILSGGDPLMLDTSRLQLLLDGLADIAHVKTIRWHTRMPIVLPERVTDEWLALLRQPRFRQVVVVHCNHADEIDPDVAGVLQRLTQIAQLTVLNQAVFLKGINDTAAAQVALSETLFANGVLPYYLHALDPVAGAAHFQVESETMQEIVRQMRTQLPGYLVPRLVCEILGEASKTPL